MRKMMIAAGLVSLIAAPAWAQGVEHAPPGGAYKKVSELVKLPDFLPGSTRFMSIRHAARRPLPRL